MLHFSYASDLYKAGVDIKQVQHLLGHSDSRNTLGIYTFWLCRCGN
ncbi:tyrosine-type recombinase/integrase [Clostridium sp. Marseille-P2415]